MQETPEPGLGKPRVLWSAANEKTKYKALEGKVRKKLKEAKKSPRENDARRKLEALSRTIYESVIEGFSNREDKKTTSVMIERRIRRESVLAQLRKQKRDLQKHHQMSKEA